MFNINQKREMKRVNFKWKNVATIVACLAVLLSANNVLAQTFNYTDASGVTCEYEVNYTQTYDDGSFPVVTLKKIITMPSSVTKWALPETVTNSNIGYRVWYNAALNNPGDGGNLVSQLTEIVFPKFMKQIAMNNSTVPTTNLHKVTFGEYAEYCSTNLFGYSPFDTVIFKGARIFVNDDGYVKAGFRDCFGVFGTNPTGTKIIIPCGTMAKFVTSMTNYPNTWNGGLWTSANLVEAECLNTLTVLSSDNNLGLATANCGWLWSNATTQGNVSGNVTLYALPKGGTVFLGWNDGNLDNPRIVNVQSDVTFTANFAACSGAGVAELRSAPAFQVFPNPAKDNLTVQLQEDTAGTLAVFDLNGRIVKSQPINGSTAVINTSSLASGIYVIRLEKGGTAVAGVKFVKE
jgi:hypothetical protein